MKKWLLGALFAMALPVYAAADITVAVASNAQYVFGELAQHYTKKTGQVVKGSFNASGKFTTQIRNGAPYAVFMSADTHFPDVLAKDKLVLEAPKEYAHGQLVLWSTQKFDVSNWRAALAKGGHKLAIANPDTAPYGRAANQVLKGLGVEGKNQIVQGTNIGQTSQYIESGVVSAGFTAKSVVLAEGMKNRGKWVEIPANMYDPIAQSVVLLKPEGKGFYDFLTTTEAQNIMKKYGYGKPNVKK
ncbi:MAG: molybdate ABC transporter substrate-binding protein [Neisseriaceae bacterium]|nr:molybdate ABC transporter substrate-binding protein [Neisseriaceae bacterium]